ncbi:MAG: hypothetical protein ACKV2U_18095 [Bryobacteraceae bacterium]
MPPWTDRVNRLVLGAVLTACSAGVVHAEPAASSCAVDKRCHALRDFFLRYNSPLEKLAVVFVRAADDNRLDWRLLPAISMVETTGGNHGTRSNVFGWNSGKTRFASVEAGILFVAERLARSPIYAGRTAMGILRKYNPAREAYPQKVTRFMMELSNDPVH